jgi:predicted transposase YbfD/YdcC
MTIIEALAEVEDPRAYNVQHDLTDILFVALVATLCGAKSCTEMAIFTQTRLALLRQVVPLKNGAPSHNTFSAVFRVLNPKIFETVLRRFMATFGEQARADLSRHLAVDGKCSRRAYDKGHAHMPPLTVTVFDCDNLLSLAHAEGADGGEAQAAIEALSLLSLDGCTVTGDALNCHRRFTSAVRKGGGDYVITLKGNQSALAKDAAAALDRAAANPKTKVAETQDDAHGRIETRRAFVIPFTQATGKNSLIDLRAIARVETTRNVDGKISRDIRTFVMSKKVTPERLLEIVRKHWLIENQLHWQLDVLMTEDQSRTRKDHGPINLAVLRRLALNILRSDPQNIPLSHKRLKAGWDNQALLNALTHMR